MRRLAIATPAVARRSPAITTPSAERIATTVVACVMSNGVPAPPTTGVTPAGLTCRNSSTKDGPGSTPGAKRGSIEGSVIGGRA